MSDKYNAVQTAGPGKKGVKQSTGRDTIKLENTSVHRDPQCVDRKSGLTHFLVCLLFLSGIFSSGVSAVEKETPPVNQSIGYLIFSEVLYRENRSGEWFELYNPTNQTIDLTGYRIENDDFSFTFPSGYKVAPQSFFTVVRPQFRDSFENFHGFSADYYPEGFNQGLDSGRGGFFGGGDYLTLLNPQGDQVDFVAWDRLFVVGFFRFIFWRDFIVEPGQSIVRASLQTDTNLDSDWVPGKIEGDPDVQAIPNLSPVANINGPYSGTVGESISFSSNGSNDPDGTIVAYSWNFGDGSNSSAANPTHIYSEAGTYLVTLTLTDDDGAQTDEVTSVQVVSNFFKWTGMANNRWENGRNWVGREVPGSTPSKDIEIPSSGNNPVLGTSLTLSGISLRMSDGADLTIADDGSLVIDRSGSISTDGEARIILESGSNYVNRSVSDPFLQLNREITGNKGWRMISNPFGQSFNDIFQGELVTQGFTGSDFPELQSNVLFWDETDAGTTLQGWRQPADATDTMQTGSGYFYFVFDGAGRPDNDLFYSDELPVTISVRGKEQTPEAGYTFGNLTYTPRDVSNQETGEGSVFIDRNLADQGWNLVGNPTPSTLNWDSNAWTKTNISETIYVWDPASNGGSGDYLVWNGLTGSLLSGNIAPMQAFWVLATGSEPALSFTNAAKTDGKRIFHGKEQMPSAPSIELNASFGEFSKKAWITFSGDGKDGADKWDAFHLEGMTDSWMSFYTRSSAFRSGLSINNLPSEQDDIKLIDVVLGAYRNNEAQQGEFTLKWKRSGVWPSDFNVYLQDAATQQLIPVTEYADSIRFYYESPLVESGNMKLRSSDPSLSLPELKISGYGNERSKVGSAGTSSSRAQQRFTLLISDKEIYEFLPDSPTLFQNYPNPFNPATTLQFSVPEQAYIRLQIFDLLGRLVAEPATGIFNPGIHKVIWDASRQSSGIYIYRLIADDRVVQTEKMTLIK